MNLTFERLCLSLLYLCLSAAAFNLIAQDLDDVRIAGQVVDQNGLAIADASVRAFDLKTGAERVVKTDGDGRYSIIELKPGRYQITAAAAGFGAVESGEMTTISGQAVRLDFNLSPAAITARQDVNAGDDAAVIDTSRTVVGGTITEREIEEIPNNTRNPLDLVLTLGGTSEEQLSTTGLAEDRSQNPAGTPLEQGNFSLSGGTAYSNNITIDGLDNNDDRSSRDRFQPSLEAISEVQVITNQFSAEYGRASGGRINLQTRSGGNRLRGRAFMFFRDNRLNANSWYNNSRAVDRPPLTENDPGFTLSGPLTIPRLYSGRNRTFFAIAYEFVGLDDTTLIDAYLPAAQNPRFALPASTGGEQSCDGTPSSGPNTPCNPTAGAPTAAYIAPYRKVYATPSRSHIATARLDHKLFRGNDLTLGWQFGRKQNRRTNGAAAARLEEAFQAKNVGADAVNFTDNQIFGAKVVNQFRGQWSRFQPSFQTDDPSVPVVLIGYRDPVTNSLRTLVAGNSTTSTSLNFADSRNETRWQFQDSLSAVVATHTIKAGFDVQNIVSRARDLGDATGTFNFASALDFGNNKISRFRQNFGTSNDVTNRYFGVFVNDEFRPASNVTLSYGLRYERETAVDDDNNFGPRLGIAWDPTSRGGTVVRFGAGIFYNRVLLRTVADSIQVTGGDLVSFDTNTIGTSGSDPRRVAILSAVQSTFPRSYAADAELRALVARACSSVATNLPCGSNTGFASNLSSAGNPLRSVDANLPIPESYQLNIGFERQIGKQFALEANYTWNRTVRLWRDYNPNAPVLPAGYADWTAYLVANPFQLSPTRRYTFYLGSNSGDGSGLSTVMNPPANTPLTTPCTTTVNCFVNLNTINASSVSPAVAVAGQNNNATGSPIGIALAAIARFRPDQTVEETSRIGARGRALYQGLVIELRRRYRPIGLGFGANFRIAYTLSSTRDDGLNNTSNAEINGDFSREWARSLQDRRHRLAVTGTFDTPRWLGRVKFSPLIRFGSSAPFNLGPGGADRNLDDLGTDRLDYAGDLADIRWRRPGTPFPAALAARFSLQPIGARSGNLPRNAGTGPKFYTFDLNVTREWKFRDRLRLRPLAEFDNVLNAAVFSYGAEFIDFASIRSDGTQPTASQLLARQNFLVPTRTYRQRQIRLGFRLDF